MSVNFSQEMEDSGEIVFQNHTHHSQRESVDHGGSSSIASQLGTESVTHQSANTNVGNSCSNDISDQLMGIRDMIKQQLVDIHMLNGKLVSINQKVDSKIADLRNEMHDVVRESHSVRRENEAIREDHPLIIHNSPPILEYEGNPRENHMQPIGSPRLPKRHRDGFNHHDFQMGDIGNRHLPNSHSTPHPDRNENRGFSPINHSKGNAKPRTFDGSEDFDDYLSQFEIIADINRWDYHSKSLQLAGKLAGQACGILGELRECERRDYDSLVNALKMRFGSLERSEMFRARLKARTKGNSETLSEFAQSIKKLTRQAYPKADQNIIDLLALDHFIDALPDPEMRFRIRESRPKHIGEAEITAIRLETYKFADSQKEVHVNSVASKSGQETETVLEKFLSKLNKTLNDNFDKMRQEISKSNRPNMGQSRPFQGNNNYQRSQNWNNHNQGNRQPNNNQFHRNWQNNHYRGNGNNGPNPQNRNPQHGYENSNQGNPQRSSLRVENRSQ